MDRKAQLKSSGLYADADERMADVLIANCNTHIRLSNFSSAEFTSTNDYEKSIALEERTAAISRLAIDEAMTK